MEYLKEEPGPRAEFQTKLVASGVKNGCRPWSSPGCIHVNMLMNNKLLTSPLTLQLPCFDFSIILK